MAYSSYEGSHKKQRTIFEKNEKHENKLANLKTLSVEWNAKSFKKKIRDYSTEVLYIDDTQKIIGEIEFVNFPEWILPFINIRFVLLPEQGQANAIKEDLLGMGLWWPPFNTFWEESGEKFLLQYYSQVSIDYVGLPYQIRINLINPYTYKKINNSKR